MLFEPQTPIEIPVFQTAEELIVWLIITLDGIHRKHGLVLLTGDDIFNLFSSLENFAPEAARSIVENETIEKG